jgi:putative addiction module component (TIGR02574 family)
MTALAQSLSTLPIEEKLQLVWDLWDSITDQSKIPVKAEDIEEMERRLDEYESDGDKGETWEVVRERIRARL